MAPVSKDNWYYRTILTRIKEPKTNLLVSAAFAALTIGALFTSNWYDAPFTLFIALVYVERWAFSSVIRAKDEEIKQLSLALNKSASQS